MAEFGENLRKAREKRGLTQQTVAEQLFVTRQAVSRWEGGSRYPDLMTAKKLSQFLDISLDELLSDQDMALYAKKSAILESPVSGGVQTAMLSFAFMCCLISGIWELFMAGNLRGGIAAAGPALLIDVIKTAALAGALGYGIVMSVRSQINPKIVLVISGLFFGTPLFTAAASGAVYFGSGRIIYYEGVDRPVWIGIVILNLLALLIMAGYFRGNVLRSPLPVYAISGLYGALAAVRLEQEIRAGILPGGSLAASAVGNLGGLTLLGMLCCMAHVLYRKRKRAVI